MKSIKTTVMFSLVIATISAITCVKALATVGPRDESDQESVQIESNQAWSPAMQLRVKRVSRPRISPSGQRVAFEVAHADIVADRWVRQTYLKSLSETEAGESWIPFEGCWDAQWGSDDSVLFVRAIDGEGQERVQRLNVETGLMTPITPENTTVGWYSPSPTGELLAYTTFEDGRWDFKAIHVANGQTFDWDDEGSVGEFSWSPNGERIVAAYLPMATMDWRQKSLVLFDLTDGTTSGIDTGIGAAWMPQFGPDGRQVAFVASPGEATWMRDAELRIIDLENGRLITLAKTPDRNVDLLAWSPIGQSLLGLEYKGSTRRLVSVPLDGSPSEYVGPYDRSIRDADLSGELIAFVSESWNEPPEVFCTTLTKIDCEQISFIQETPEAPIGRTTMIQWESDDGTMVEGLLTYPVGYDGGTPVPLLVRLHGGPPFPAADSFLGGTYMTAYPLASLASAGFAILQPNFRGSAGYGRAFRHDLHADWGGQDYQDVISGVDSLIAQGIADPHRLGIMGWSYGGYLSAWTITQNDRFVAASIGAAMTDLRSFDDQTSLIGMLPDWFGGPVETRAERYRLRSPITFAHEISCPVLLQHGTNDTTVPLEQASTFAATLKDRGIPHELQTYSGGHGPRRPQTELAVLEQNLEWFQHWILESSIE